MTAHNKPRFIKAAEQDVVHHSAAWVVKADGHQPVFVDCKVVEDAGSEKGYSLDVSVWRRGEAGLWEEERLDSEARALNDAYDGESFAKELSEDLNGAYAKIPYNVFEEVVDEHDLNFNIAPAVAIDYLPDEATRDAVSARIRENADADIAERSGRVVRDQEPEGLDSICANYEDVAGEAPYGQPACAPER